MEVPQLKGIRWKRQQRQMNSEKEGRKETRRCGHNTSFKFGKRSR
ncbi:MAG: hypothetical protein KatS3mg105_2455 [Gemmatales bacterium]|nr:MAG: hypothetical protein KatS3mg105_2455 [Gemmatales bacterium]